MAAEHNLSSKRGREEVEHERAPDGESSKCLRRDHREDETDADTCSTIGMSDGGSDHGDELETDAEPEDGDDEQKKPEPKADQSSDYAPFLFMNDDKSSMRVKCTKCHTKFDTTLVETLLKPVDVEIEDTDELDGGHVALRCNIIFKRRTFVRCPVQTCGKDNKLPNNVLDEQAGEVYGDVLKSLQGDNNVYLDKIRHNISALPRHYILSSLTQLFGPPAKRLAQLNESMAVPQK